MSDEEIVKEISRECGLMILLSIIGRKALAQRFANHILRVVTTNRHAVERWMNARKIELNSHI